MECSIGKRKHFRRVFARFDKYAKRFLTFVHFASMIIWLKYTRQQTSPHQRQHGRQPEDKDILTCGGTGPPTTPKSPLVVRR